MATSAINVAGKDIEVRRLAGCQFLLTMIFQEDGEPWDISGLNIKVRVTNSNDALVTTWIKNTHFSVVGTNTIMFDRTSPESLGLAAPNQYKILVYIDSASGVQPLAGYNLYIDSGLSQSNRATYSTGTFAPEALILNVVSSIPGLTSEVYGQLLTQITLLEGEIENLQSLIVGAVYNTIEDVEAAATGPYPKVFNLVSGGNGRRLYYMPGVAELLENFTFVAGGAPVYAGGPTVTERVSTLEESSIAEVADYDELVTLPYLSLAKARTLFVLDEQDDGEGGTYPSGLYRLYPTGQIKYMLNGAEYRADQTIIP